MRGSESAWTEIAAIFTCRGGNVIVVELSALRGTTILEHVDTVSNEGRNQ